ncbi:tetratricopeptide repeat protein [Labilibaculum manganireducens]|uniref:tetratricopeptide repeat protein n=1 Tax=Labilibaculum manganireducens TaxID=1940525 RepID=UPI0029F57705|nr:tetratricopeptide repeat protein [Labilibaculum manganireducens]
MRKIIVGIILFLAFAACDNLNKKEKVTCLINNTKYDEALSYIESILIETGEEPWLFESKGLIYKNQHQFKLSEENYLKALKLGGDKMANFINLGDVLFKNKDYAKAHDVFLLCYNIDSANYTVNYNLGLCNYFLDDLDNAIKYISKVNCISPDETGIYFLKAEILNKKGEYIKGIESVNKGLILDNRNDYGYFLKGMLYFNLKNYLEAIANFNDAIQINPNSLDYYCNIGIAFHMIDSCQKSVLNFNKAIELDSMCNYAYLGKFHVYKDLKNDSLAEFNYLMYKRTLAISN